MAALPDPAFTFAELQTPEPGLSARFYTALFSWYAHAVADDYWVFELNGKAVCGMRRAPEHRWIACVAVADDDPFAARAAASGARVDAPAHVTGIARTRLVVDPEGAAFVLWKADGLDGTQVDAGPGSLWWIELATADMAAARDYYAALFGWGLVHTMQFENSPRGYTLFKVNERSVAGAFQYEPEWGLSPMWQVYVEVSDFAAAVAQACALGGEDGFWRDVPRVGRIGVIVDPGGASFLVAHPRPRSAIPPAPA